MRFGRTFHAAAAAALAAVWTVSPAFGQSKADEKRQSQPGRSPESLRALARNERVSGVIVKVEHFVKGASPGSTIEREAVAGRNHPVTYRLTVNTNAVWRDWARDQARMQDSGPAKKDARRGENSVATAGEPADRNSLVVVDIGPETKIDTRFRAADDETGKGSKSPEAVVGKDAGRTGRSSAKPVQFRTSDLKPGLFVEVDFRHVTAQNPASAVAVIRPIGGPASPARTEAAGTTKSSK